MAEQRAAQARQLYKWRTIYRTLLNLLIALIVLAALIALIVIISRQGSNTDLLQDVRQSNQILVDCTTPGHGCYDQAHKNSSSTVRQLDEVIVLSNFCANVPGNDTLPKVRRCVENGLH